MSWSPTGSGIQTGAPSPEKAAISSRWPDTHAKQLENCLRQSIITHLRVRQDNACPASPLHDAPTKPNHV